MHLGVVTFWTYAFVNSAATSGIPPGDLSDLRNFDLGPLRMYEHFRSEVH
jgi:hypothetical protein